MKTIELLNIEDLNKLVGGEITDIFIDKYETNKIVSKSLSYDFSKLAELTK